MKTKLLILVVCIAAISSARAQDSTIQNVDRRKTIVAASNMLHPPFSSLSNDGIPVGIEVEIVNAAADELGLTVDWIERPFPELFDAINNGEIDVAVSTIGVTDERKQKVAFTNPYYETEIVALVKPNSKINTLAQIENLKVGADQSTTSYQAARRRWPNAPIVGAVTQDKTWPQMIEDGTIDAFVVDASDQSRLESISGIKLRRIVEPMETEKFAVAVSKPNIKLLAAINRSIVKMRPAVKYRIGDEFQFVSPLGTRIPSLSGVPSKLVDDYLKAKSRLERNPNDADAIIWLGRRLGYLQRMNEAIDVFSDGIEKHPTDARMYRHRGHRYISIRQFDKAIKDFNKAVELMKNLDEQVEPDGAPNQQGIPLTTLQSNVWYHLGLAYYLKNDLPNALRCFQRDGQHKYDDNVVSNAHWVYMILRRMGKVREAAKNVERINSKMNIIENFTYHQMCLFYNKQVGETDLTLQTNKDTAADILLYGMGNWYLYEKHDKAKSQQLFEQLLKDGSPFSFAFIATEADYHRLFESSDRLE